VLIFQPLDIIFESRANKPVLSCDQVLDLKIFDIKTMTFARCLHIMAFVGRI